MYRRSMTGDNAGRVQVFRRKMELKTAGFNPSQLKLDDVRIGTEARVASNYRVAPQVLMFLAGLRHSTYSNQESARRSSYERLLIPLWRVLASALTKDLISEFPVPNGKWRFQFDTSDIAVLQEDLGALTSIVQSKLDRGIITLNEAREALGHSNLGTAGDVFWSPVSGYWVPASELTLAEDEE